MRKEFKEMIDFLIIGVIAVCVALAVVYKVKMKKTGERGCCTGCSSCPSKGNCSQ